MKIETKTIAAADNCPGRTWSTFQTAGLRIRITTWEDHSTALISMDGTGPGSTNVQFFLEETELATLAEAIENVLHPKF